MLVTSGYDSIAAYADCTTRQTLRIAVPRSGEAAWESLRNKTRNMVRKAERNGVRVVSGIEFLDGLYRCYSARMLAKGVPVHAREFFRAFLTRCGDAAEVLVARIGTRVVGGMLLLTSPSSAAYPFQATLPEGERSAATALLTWDAVRRCAERGIPFLDMGESTPGSGTFHAKSNFGGVPVPVWYVRMGIDRAAARRSASGVFAVRVARWGMLHAPYGIGVRCGVWARRHGRLT